MLTPVGLPEITFRAPAAPPPIVLFGALLICTPTVRLAIAPVPAALVPIKLPCTLLPEAAEPPAIATPMVALPEITLPAPDAVPPTVLFGAALIWMPCWAFATAAVPLASVP